MSDRNTGLFLPGHVPADAISRAFLSIKGISSADLAGDEAPRVGHGRHHGQPYTYVGLRLFDVGGVALLESAEPPSPDDFEVQLGESLSMAHGKALFLQYEDEKAVGGHALFEGGRLSSRRAIDGTESRPVVRDMDGQRPLQNVDPSDWVWTPMAAAVEMGSKAIFTPALRNDDDIERVIETAEAKAIDLAAAPAPRAAPAASAPPQPAGPAPTTAPPSSAGGSPPAGGGLLGRLARKVAGKVRGR